jgi:hypothetical protein
MSNSQWSRWVPVLLVMGCSGKLQVDAHPPGGAGAGGLDAMAGAQSSAIYSRALTGN